MNLKKLTTAVICIIQISSCGNQTADSFTEEKNYKEDTVYVTVDVSSSNRDSLERIYGKFVSPGDEALLKQGESVSAKVRLTIPLIPQSWVNDYENLYSDSELHELDTLIDGYEKRTSVEIAVVTIDSNWTTRQDFDNFVLRLHNTWGVGKKEKNNGIVIGISRGYRMIRISNGYGIEGKITDEETKVLIDSAMIPEFVKGDYFTGTKKGIERIQQELAK